MQQLTKDPVITTQFPTLYGCQSLHGEDIRYAVSLALVERGAHWVARVWAADAFLGEVRGGGSGPTSSCTALARMQVESQLRCPGKLGPPLGR